MNRPDRKSRPAEWRPGTAAYVAVAIGAFIATFIALNAWGYAA